MDLKKIRDQVRAKTIEKVEKDLLIEKRNLIGRKLLRLLPFQIFILVADADGKTDTKELAQFKDFLNQREKHCSNPYTRRMFHTTVVNYAALTNRYLGGHIKKDFSIVQKAMDYIRICVSQTMTAEICSDLRELAVSIAEASGGFLGMTTPIGQEEEKVIKQLNKIFDQAIELAGRDDVPSSGRLDF
ncbi:MAG: hypothetical protein GY866_43730 [Proteobacteria bacterium]|nr:hypothetical protein [Pseudomonadota bacterium]